MRALLVLSTLSALVPAAACGDNAAAPPVVIDGADVTVTIEQAPARIVVVRKADGEVIFDGLPGGAVDAPTAPHVAAAFRAATAEVETQVGAFRFAEDAVAPWTGVETIQAVAGGGLLLADADGARLGTVAVTLDEARGPGTQVTIRLTAAPGRGVNRTSIAGRCAEDEHFLGLGGQSFDVDHRGHTVPLWVEEDGITKRADDSYDGVWFLAGRRHSTHTPMPMMLSSRGYAAAVESDARTIFALCSEGAAAGADDAADVLRLETWHDTLALHLFVGAQDPDDPRQTPLRASLDLMTRWTGRRPPPPRFAFAPWLDAIYGQDEVARVAQRLRAEDIPVSVIWSEDWRGGNDEGTGYVLEEDWTVDRDIYPDFEDLAATLHDDGFKFLVYHNTFIDEEADVFEEALAEGHAIHRADGTPYLFTGVKFRPATMLDLTNPAARTWAKDVMGEAYELGADGWMADFAEWLPHDAALASGEDPMLHHNRYPVEWARLNREMIDARADDGVERLTFMRAAWLGSQPLIDVIWAGDQQTDFSVGDGLASVIPMGIGLGLVGLPYFGHDIAGYMSQLTEPTTKELWLRWCSFGALSPVMRTHHGRDARNNWSWERDDETIAHLRRWAKIHMQLVPYLDAMAARFEATGAPIMQPVALEYPDAGAWAWTTTDQYLLGDRILVAPVIEAGATSRDVTLPEGAWYPLLGGAAITAGDGGDTITVAAPVTELPAFVPAGAVLRLQDPDIDTVVAAPGSPTTVVDGDRPRPIAVVWPGTADHPWHAALGAWTWTGREPALDPPAFATIDGDEVATTAGDGHVSVVMSDCASVTFEGGGSFTDTTCAGGTVEVRLIAP